MFILFFIGYVLFTWLVGIRETVRVYNSYNITDLKYLKYGFETVLRMDLPAPFLLKKENILSYAFLFAGIVQSLGL